MFGRGARQRLLEATDTVAQLSELIASVSIPHLSKIREIPKPFYGFTNFASAQLA